MTVGAMDELFSQIEAVHGKTWNLWCTYDGKYVIQIRVSKTVSGLSDTACLGPNGSLVALLQEAAAYRFMLQIYRKPCPPPARSRYAAQKLGSKWGVLLDGTCILAAFKTKTEAECAIDKRIALIVAERSAWDEQVAPLIDGKVEGIDYRFV